MLGAKAIKIFLCLLNFQLQKSCTKTKILPIKLEFYHLSVWNSSCFSKILCFFIESQMHLPESRHEGKGHSYALFVVPFNLKWINTKINVKMIKSWRKIFLAVSFRNFIWSVNNLFQILIKASQKDSDS